MSTKSGLDLKNMEVGFDSLLGFIGFACYLVSLLNLFVLIPYYGTFSELAYMEMRVIAALAVVVVVASIYSAANSLAGSRARVLEAIAIIGVVVYLSLILLAPENLTAFSALLAIAAIGMAALGSLWFAFFCSQSSDFIIFYVAIAFCMASVICMLEIILPGVGLHVVVFAVPVISLLCSVMLLHMYPKKALPESVSNEDSDKRSKIQWSSAIMLASVFFELGFMISIAANMHSVLVCLAVAFAAAFIISIDSVNRGFISEKSLSPITAPLLVGTIVSIYLFDETISLVALSILTALVVAYLIFGQAAMIKHVTISKLSSLRTYSKARLLDYMGFGLGLSVGYCVANLMASSVDSVKMCLGIVVVLALIASFNNRPLFPDKSIIAADSQTPTKGKGLWSKRCRAAAEEFGLSERQYEVLVLIAQGRNAKFIGETFTISLSTAQTHIRNIYRKLNVHSRQELLNLIENTKLYGED